MENQSELPTETNTVYKKIHACMSELSFIEKDKKNTFYNYNYASEEAIKKAVHEQLVKNGLIFTVDMQECIQIETKNKKGDKTYITNVKVKYCFIDIDSGDSLCGSFYGTGEDAMDKGTYKALTGAIKYILTSTFLIPTGDDPENETEKKAEEKKEVKAPSPPTATNKAISKACDRILNGELGIVDKMKIGFSLTNEQVLLLEATQLQYEKEAGGTK